MVNSESLCDIFKSEGREKVYFKGSKPVKLERRWDRKLIDNRFDTWTLRSTSEIGHSRSSDTTTEAHTTNICGVDSNRNDEDQDLSLHLSPDSEEFGEDSTINREEVVLTELQPEVLEDSSSEELYFSLSFPSSGELGGSPNNDNNPIEIENIHNSPDMFCDSQETLSQDMFLESSATRVSNEDATTSSEQRQSGENNQEQLEEWDSQELTDISQRLKIRGKQVKRLIMAVIRKRQMADESLGAVKKRLKKL